MFLCQNAVRVSDDVCLAGLHSAFFSLAVRLLSGPIAPTKMGWPKLVEIATSAGQLAAQYTRKECEESLKSPEKFLEKC